MTTGNLRPSVTAPAVAFYRIAATNKGLTTVAQTDAVPRCTQLAGSDYQNDSRRPRDERARRLVGDACPLLRDTPVIPEDPKKAAAPASVQMPPGIVPGVGGIGSGPLTSVPGLGV